jgi:hypothetical protein
MSLKIVPPLVGEWLGITNSVLGILASLATLLVCFLAVHTDKKARSELRRWGRVAGDKGTAFVSKAATALVGAPSSRWWIAGRRAVAVSLVVCLALVVLLLPVYIGFMGTTLDPNPQGGPFSLSNSLHEKPLQGPTPKPVPEKDPLPCRANCFSYVFGEPGPGNPKDPCRPNCEATQ